MTAPREATAIPEGLGAPALAAALSAALLVGCVFLFADAGPAGGIAALLPTAVGVGAGVKSAAGLLRNWRKNRGADRVRRAAWIGATVVLLLPFAYLTALLAAAVLYVVAFVRP